MSAIYVATQIQSAVLGWQVYLLTSDPFALGLVGLAEAVPFLALTLVGGWAADRTDRRRVSLLSFGAVGLSGLALLLVSLGRPGPVLPALRRAGAGRHRARLLPPRLGRAGQRAGAAGALPERRLLALLALPRRHGAGPGRSAAGSSRWAARGWPTAWWWPSRPPAWSSWPPSRRARARPAPPAPSAPASPRGSASSSPSPSCWARSASTSSPSSSAAPRRCSRSSPATCWASARWASASCAPPRPSARSSWPWCWRASDPSGAPAALLLWCVAGFGVTWMLFALSRSYALSLALLVVGGALDGVSVVLRGTLVQLWTPQAMMGRVAAVNSFFIGSSNELGAFESGLAARLLGVVPSVLFGGAMTLVTVGWVAWRAPALRRLRHLAPEGADGHASPCVTGSGRAPTRWPSPPASSASSRTPGSSRCWRRRGSSPARLCGSSAGALVGGLFAAGLPAPPHPRRAAGAAAGGLLGSRGPGSGCCAAPASGPGWRRCCRCRPSRPARGRWPSPPGTRWPARRWCCGADRWPPPSRPPARSPSSSSRSASAGAGSSTAAWPIATGWPAPRRPAPPASRGAHPLPPHHLALALAAPGQPGAPHPQPPRPGGRGAPRPAPARAVPAGARRRGAGAGRRGDAGGARRSGGGWPRCCRGRVTPRCSRRRWRARR